jgi:hypothetical protein
MSLRTATRHVHRPGRNGDGEAHVEVVAAADFRWTRPSDRKWLAANIARSQMTGRRPWLDYERIGEVRKAISRAARIAGYAKLRCVEVNPDGTDGKTIETGDAAEIVQGIYAPYGGVRGLVDRFFACMKVPGDSILLRYLADDGEYDGYHFASADEIQWASVGEASFANTPTDDLKWITLPAGGGGAGSEALTRPVRGRDVLGRVWLPGRRWIDIPDSPLAALETECEVLWGLTEAMKANIYQRFILGGMMAFPSEVQTVRVAGIAQGPNQSLLEYVEQAMLRNVEDLSTAESRIPILISCQGEHIDQIKVIHVDREIFETDLRLRAELIERILFGLDIQVQATKGNEDANHFTSWVQSDEEVRIAVQPDLDTMCWALTRLVLHKQLSEERGWSDGRIMGLKIAWDMSESSTRTNRQEDARQLWDRATLGNAPMMRVSGFSPTDDQMSEAELIRWAGIKHDNAYLTLCGLDKIDDLDWEQVEKFAKIKPGPSADGEGEDPSAGPGVGEPGSPSETERGRTGRTSKNP